MVTVNQVTHDNVSCIQNGPNDGKIPKSGVFSKANDSDGFLLVFFSGHATHYGTMQPTYIIQGRFFHIWVVGRLNQTVKFQGLRRY